jgi:hypothetical protein
VFSGACTCVLFSLFFIFFKIHLLTQKKEGMIKKDMEITLKMLTQLYIRTTENQSDLCGRM